MRVLHVISLNTLKISLDSEKMFTILYDKMNGGSEKAVKAKGEDMDGTKDASLDHPR